MTVTPPKLTPAIAERSPYSFIVSRMMPRTSSATRALSMQPLSSWTQPLGQGPMGAYSVPPMHAVSSAARISLKTAEPGRGDKPLISVLPQSGQTRYSFATAGTGRG